MAKLTYQRLDDILDALLVRNDPWLLTDMAETLNVSDRTIRSDIKILNQILEEYDSEIKLIRGKGYLLQTNNQSNLIDWWISFEDMGLNNTLGSLEERQNYLIFLLLKEERIYSAEELMDVLFISKNTFYTYMKNIRDLILPFGLKIINRPNIGFEIIGNEFNKRIAISELLIKKDLQEYLLGFTDIEKAICSNIDLNKLQAIELTTLSPLSLLESDFYHKNILSTFALSLSRIKGEHPLTQLPVATPSLIDVAIAPVDNFFATLEEAFVLQISEIERNYFIYHLSINMPRLVKSPSEELPAVNVAAKIVQQLLVDINQENNYNWLEDSILVEDLISHIEGFINMNLMEAGRKNPLLETIKTSFPLAYDLSMTHLEPIGKAFNLYFSEDEIGYIALHIAGALERNSPKQRPLNIVIVCGSGKTMSRIVESKINKLYAQQISIVARVSYAEFKQMNLSSLDLIVTTVPILEVAIPTIFINMNELDKSIDKLGSAITRLNLKNINLDDLFAPEYFLSTKNPLTKASLLARLVSPLLENKIVTEDFLESVMERELLHATNINERIAIPHPLTMSATTSKIAVAILPEGINWGNNDHVKFVFLLAINKDEYEDTTYIYDILLGFIEDSTAQKDILQSGDFTTFLTQFKKIQKRI